MNKNVLIGALCALGAGVSWGFSGSCGQYLFMNYGTDTMWLTTVRLLCAGVILLLLCLCNGTWRLRGFFSVKMNIVQLVFFGALGLMFCQFSYLAAISHSNAGTATVLQYLFPLFLMFWVCAQEKRAPRSKEILAIVLALGGTFILATHGDFRSLSLTPTALFWGIMSAFGAVIYTLSPVKLVDRFGNLPIMAYGMLIGGVILAAISQFWNIPVNLDLKGVLAVGGLVIFGTTIPFSVYMVGVQKIGAVNAGLLASAEPVSAVIISALWLGTEFLPPDIIGIILILIMVLILAKSKEKKQAVEK